MYPDDLLLPVVLAEQVAREHASRAQQAVQGARVEQAVQVARF